MEPARGKGPQSWPSPQPDSRCQACGQRSPTATVWEFTAKGTEPHRKVEKDMSFEEERASGEFSVGFPR